MRISVRVMMRKLAITLLSACLIIIPLSAQAMGFGNIRIKSALNEPLDAEIELLSATESDLKGLKIKLASREAFLRSGIERPDHLSQLQFSIKRHSNGRAYLQIHTKQSMREPFLDFLLEMDWKNGRMLREYTVLLDPPGRMQQQPTLVESPETQSPVVVAKQEQKQTETPFVEPEPVVVEQSQPEPVPAPAAAMAEPAPVVAEPLVADEPVTASSIAEADVEAEPVPLAESVPEKDLQLAEEPTAPAPVAPSAGEDLSIAKAADAPAAQAEDIPLTEESADTGYPDPFAGEKFPRIPIKLDKHLREAEEAELAAIQVEGEPALAKVPLPDEAVATEKPLQKEPLAEEPAMAAQAEEPLAGEALAEQPEQAAHDAVDSVTTKRGDKLWNIAQSMKPDESVTIYQVMMALLQSNPDAFTQGNVHRLKVGKVLRIEDPSLLTAMSKHQAAQQYIAQTQAWEDYRQQFAANTGSTPVQAEMASGRARGEREVLPETAPAERSGELVLSAPEGETQTAGSTGDKEATVNNEVVILREEIRHALAEAEAEGNKNVILNEKLRDLEGQLQDLQRSVTVQDDELATLQKQLSDLNKKNTEAEQAAVVAPHAEMPSVPTTTTTITTTTTTEPAVKSETELLAEAQQQAAPVVAPPAPAAKPEVAVAPPAESAPGAVDKTLGVFDSIKKTFSGMLSILPFSPLILLTGAGVIVVLLLLVLLLVQRRRQAANFQESILSGIPSHEIMASEEASLETNLSGESSFLSDFAISGASALQGDDGDVDPLTEADVFMAYGRYEAAEERILEAIKKDPQRQELRIKLLELYNTTKNKPAFVSAAKEMFASLGNDAANPIWQKVVVMGSMLAPENPLFGERPAGDVTRVRNMPGASAKQEPVIDDLGLDLDFAMDDDKSNTSAALDFDLDTGNEESIELVDKDEFDFQLDADESARIETSGLDFELPAADKDLTDSFGLDLSLEDTAQTEVALDLDAELPGDDTAQFKADGSLDFDMSDIENDESSMGLTLDMDIGAPKEDHAGDGMTMEMSQPTFSEMEMPTMEAEVDATDISDLDSPSLMDEVGTKLDLAKAYIDMGDPDGARSILDEVLEEGTPPQQQEAQQLMQQI